MPIGFPAGAAGGGSANLMRPLYSPGNSNGLRLCTDGFYSPLIGSYVYVLGDGTGFFYGAAPMSILEYANSGISASGAECRGTEFDGRLYRVRLGNTVATAVRSTPDLVNWQTDFGGIIINDVNNDAAKLVLATNYAAAPDRNGIIFTGTTWDPIYSGNAANALSCLVTASGRIVFGFAGGVIRYSDNDGATWTEVVLSVAEEVEALYADSSGRLYAALDTGYCFESADDGASWSNGGIRAFGGVDCFFFSGTDEISLYGLAGAKFTRTGPFNWIAQPVPSDSDFRGSMRNTFDGGLNAAGFLVSEALL